MLLLVEKHSCHSCKRQLGIFGPTTILRSYDTYQFNDYSRYDAEGLPAERKAEKHRTQFPLDLDAAYNLGRRLVEETR